MLRTMPTARAQRVCGACPERARRAGAHLRVARALEPALERGENRALRRVAHGEDERELELRLVRRVERREPLELGRRERAEDRAAISQPVWKPNFNPPRIDARIP